jgi:hypothetical protein
MRGGASNDMTNPLCTQSGFGMSFEPPHIMLVRIRIFSFSFSCFFFFSFSCTQEKEKKKKKSKLSVEPASLERLSPNKGGFVVWLEWIGELVSIGPSPPHGAIEAR